MTPFIPALTLVGSALGLIFSFWPFCVFAPLLGWRRGRNRGMIVLWLSFCLSWLMTRLFSSPQLVRLIPEPLNTLLFFATGVALLAWALVAGMRGSHRIRVTPDTAQTPEDLSKLSALQLEKMIVALYHRRGYQAKRAAGAADRGVDVLVYTASGRKWIVQCKRGRSRLGERNVKSLYSALQHHKAERAILITTGTFTDEARFWAKGRPLALVDGQELLHTWKEGRIE